MNPILGIDPGNAFSAGVIIEDGRIVDKQRLPNGDFLRWLDHVKCEQITLRGFESGELRVCCEMPAMLGKGVGVFWQIFETCVVVGLCKSVFPDMARATRGSIKIAVCGKSSTNDSAVRTKLIQLYGEPGTSKRPGPTYGVTSDMWAALAVAHAFSKGCKLYDTTILKQRQKKSKT